jgi:hypothetical protein
MNQILKVEITNSRKFLIGNSLIIGSIIIIIGFIWMITDDFLMPSMDLVMSSFFFTISGLLFWWIGYHYMTKDESIINPLEVIKHHTHPKST